MKNKSAIILLLRLTSPAENALNVAPRGPGVAPRELTQHLPSGLVSVHVSLPVKKLLLGVSHVMSLTTTINQY